MDTFTQLPITMDAASKAIQTSSPSTALQAELQTLNALHRTFLSIESPAGVPPPPVPVNPKLSAAIAKMREAGNAAFRKASYPEAIKLYTLALNMALSRPPWEPSQLVKEEASAVYANRSQAYMELREWVEAAADAEASVSLKGVQNPKAWFRRGRCLLEMGRVEEAQEWVRKGLEAEGEGDAELKGLMGEIEKRLVK